MWRTFAGSVALVLVAAAAMAQEDAAGTEDHPIVSRYPGSHIVWQDVQAYQEYKIATGPVTGYRAISDWVEVAGKLTRTYYEIEGERGISEITLNYKEALEGAGFELIAYGLDPEGGTGKDVGGRSWMQVMYGANPFPSNGLIRLLAGSSTAKGSGFMAGKLEQADRTVYVVWGGAQYAADINTFVVDVIEVQEAEGGLVTIDADAMSKEIMEKGKTVIYGLYFEYDKAVLTEESKPALDEIAKLLGNEPELSVYVVGHTDMRGTLAYNLDLSEQRAAAVVEALVKDYSIARERLEPHGVGPLVPVFSNGSDAGRAKNRRVELVER